MDTSSLGSLIFPSTSQLPPSKSASDSFISFFLQAHRCTEKISGKSAGVNSTKLPFPLSSFRRVWCKWKRKGTVPEHALMNEPGQTSGATAIQHSGILALTWPGFCGGTVVRTGLLTHIYMDTHAGGSTDRYPDTHSWAMGSTTQIREKE